MVLFRDTGHFVGLLLLIFGLSMMLCLPVSWYYNDGQLMTFLWSIGITMISGLGLRFLRKQKQLQINKRTGYMVVTLGWLSMAIFGMIPFLISGAIPDITNAFFESMSGLTTTGASILTDIEIVAPSILMWRSILQWIGGMGIIVLTVAILPLLGIGGIELFVAEAPGPTSDKIHPRIQETAKRLWLIYVGLTLVLGITLYFLGMSGFDAVNHAMTTLATGGFSTRNASIAYWSSPAIHYCIILFMLLAGTNFTVLYFLFVGRLKRAWNSQEFRAYLFGVLIIFVLLFLLYFAIWQTIDELLMRQMLFSIVSVITTTGFVNGDYTAWGLPFAILFFLMLFAGGSAGSTAGGIKVIRHIVFLKNSFLEFKRILHPRGMIRIKIDHHVVEPRILTHIMVFLLVYMMTFGVGLFLAVLSGMDLVSAAGAVATTLGNVGPGIGEVGPLDNFSGIPDGAKWLCSFLMLLGRLELFTVLVIFTTFFWRPN